MESVRAAVDDTPITSSESQPNASNTIGEETEDSSALKELEMNANLTPPTESIVIPQAWNTSTGAGFVMIDLDILAHALTKATSSSEGKGHPRHIH